MAARERGFGVVYPIVRVLGLSTGNLRQRFGFPLHIHNLRLFGPWGQWHEWGLE